MMARDEAERAEQRSLAKHASHSNASDSDQASFDEMRSILAILGELDGGQTNNSSASKTSAFDASASTGSTPKHFAFPALARPLRDT